jgi:ABC-type maltose transport system permease subunit
MLQLVSFLALTRGSIIILAMSACYVARCLCMIVVYVLSDNLTGFNSDFRTFIYNRGAFDMNEYILLGDSRIV